MYTLPFATVGIVNFDAMSIVSREPAWELSYTSLRIPPVEFAGSYAKSTPGEPEPLRWIVHRIPLEDPFAEAASVAPRSSENVTWLRSVGEVDRSPFVSLNAWTLSVNGPKNTYPPK